MEQKKTESNNDYYNNYANKENCSFMNHNYKKTGIKKNSILTSSNTHKNINQKNLTIFNDSRTKQNKINQCFLDLMNTKKQKEKAIKKEKNCFEQKINTDINDFDNKSNNIRVNKIKIEKLNIENANNLNSKTNRDFYHKLTEGKKNSYLINNDSRISTHFISDFCEDKRTNVLTVKSFNTNNSEKEKDKLNTQIDNSDNSSFMNVFNKRYNNNNTLYNNVKKMNQSNIKNRTTYSSNAQSQIRITTNSSSKTLKGYKNIKTIYAHLEIFMCLYLKRIFKYFLENTIHYQKPINIININVIELSNTNSVKEKKVRPIIANVKSTNCSVFGPINSNQDKLFNTIIDNQKMCQLANNSFTPISKRRMIENSKQYTKEKINNINKRNKLLFIHPEYDKNIEKKRYDKDYTQKSIYIPKKKISKSKTDVVNRVKATSTLNNNKNHDKKSFPIKEMNINLKQINVCRLNDLNQLYLNQNLYNCNNTNFNYTEAIPIIQINNNYLTNYTRYNNNNINSINIDSSKININDDKLKLKKIKSAKNGIYTKPKEKKTEKKIKEIKIHNKFTPSKKEIEFNKRYKTKNDNLLTLYNSFDKGKNIYDISKIKKTDLFTINNNKDECVIKKIYIKTKQKSSNNFKVKEDLFDSYKKQFYSTFLSFNSNNEKKIKDINNELLVKELVTSDKRLFINVKYYLLMDNNYIRKQNNCYKPLNLQINHQYSISIIKNVLNSINNEHYKNILLNKCNNSSLKMLDIYSFDNDKNEKTQIIKSKNISFSFKECTRSKEESNCSKIINDRLNNFINILKNKIVINIRKYLYNKCKIKISLKKIIKNKTKKILKAYFSKYKNIININQIKVDINNCGIYHKINYNDDFNLNKKLKTIKNNNPKNDNNKNIKCKTKPYNLTLKNSINQLNNKKISNKKRSKEFSPINKTRSIINKEINIVVHNNTKLANNMNSGILINRLKSKFFS